jgi:hypothetical protein
LVIEQVNQLTALLFFFLVQTASPRRGASQQKK